jgi:hypothetical protein
MCFSKVILTDAIYNFWYKRATGANYSDYQKEKEINYDCGIV